MTNEELAMAIQAGDRGKLLPLWEQNRGLIAIKARRVLNATRAKGRADIDMDDLMQAGFLGLARAVDLYDPTSECPLTTLLGLTLRTALAEATGYRTERQKRDPINSAVSLSIPLGESDDGGSLEDLVADTQNNIEDAEDRIWREQRHETVEKALATLDPAQEKVLRMRYYDEKDRKTVAEEMGITLQSAKSLESRGIVKLGSNWKVRHDLEQFIDFRTNFFVPGSVSKQTSGVEIIVMRRETLREQAARFARLSARFSMKCETEQNRSAGASASVVDGGAK